MRACDDGTRDDVSRCDSFRRRNTGSLPVRTRTSLPVVATLVGSSAAFDEAVAELRKAIKLDPNLAIAKVNLEEALRLQESRRTPLGTPLSAGSRQGAWT